MANYYSYFDNSTAGQNTRSEIDDESATFGMGVSQDIDCRKVTATGEVKCSSTTAPFYPPVVTTTQRNAISGMTKGAMVFNSSTNKLNVYSGSAWEAVTSS